MTDTSQFEAFMSAYQNMVFSTAVRLLNNEADAEDVAQEVFLRAYDRFDTLGQSAGVGGWLKTVTRNLCLNHLTRYRARWRFFSEMSSSAEDSSFEQDLPSPESPDMSSAPADERQLLEDALHRLPEAQRLPLVLYHFEDLTYDAIAARLGISLSKLKTDMHRGRAALRRKLERHAGELGAGAPAPRAPAPLPPIHPSNETP